MTLHEFQMLQRQAEEQKDLAYLQKLYFGKDKQKDNLTSIKKGKPKWWVTNQPNNQS